MESVFVYRDKSKILYEAQGSAVERNERFNARNV